MLLVCGKRVVGLKSLNSTRLSCVCQLRLFPNTGSKTNSNQIPRKAITNLSKTNSKPATVNRKKSGWSRIDKVINDRLDKAKTLQKISTEVQEEGRSEQSDKAEEISTWRIMRDLIQHHVEKGTPPEELYQIYRAEIKKSQQPQTGGAGKKSPKARGPFSLNLGKSRQDKVNKMTRDNGLLEYLESIKEGREPETPRDLEEMSLAVEGAANHQKKTNENEDSGFEELIKRSYRSRRRQGPVKDKIENRPPLNGLSDYLRAIKEGQKMPSFDEMKDDHAKRRLTYEYHIAYLQRNHKKT